MEACVPAPHPQRHHNGHFCLPPRPGHSGKQAVGGTSIEKAVTFLKAGLLWLWGAGAGFSRLPAAKC